MLVISLSKPVIDLLLRVMEARTAQVAGTTLQNVSPRAAEMLLGAKLLIASGHIPVIAGMDDYEDEPTQAVWSPEQKSFGYHDSVGRWIVLEDRVIAAYRVDYGRVLAAMLLPFERQGPVEPQALIRDQLWDAGTIKMSGSKQPVPVWFARRLGDPRVWAQTAGLIERRPVAETRIVLTSTRGDRIPVAPNKRHVIVSISDVLGGPGKLAISPPVLGARVFPSEVQRRTPIDHSDDCGIVWLKGEAIPFGGDKQRQLLQLLFAAYWAKSPVRRIAVILEEVGYGAKVNSLAKAFGKRDDWRRFIKYDDGNCWIEP